MYSILIFWLCANTTLMAQAEQLPAKALFDEGITILSQTPTPSSFTKIQALEKFIQCQKILTTSSNAPTDLQLKNKEKIIQLFDFFSKYQNTDSILQSTRFFPDSIFQEHVIFDSSFKVLVREYLAFKRGVTRTAFFKIKDLTFPKILGGNKLGISRITFEHYWPLEVVDLDKWVTKELKTLATTSKKAKAEILYYRLKNELDGLKKQESTKYYERNKKRLLEKIETQKTQSEVAKQEYSKLKYLGLGTIGLLFLLGYFFWKKNDKLLKNNNQSLLEEKKRSEDLLTNMLPAEVVRELKSKGTVKAHKYDGASVLFTDFKNFSQIAENLSPEELVQELGHCFTVFDRIIDKYRLQKIKTIGDAYMCVGGLYTRGGNHVQRMIFAALEIQQFLADRKTKRKAAGQYFFEARLGIHTGPIVAGVIGSKKIAFDVWGNTVNVAQQMETHSEVGEINISGETYALVKDIFECRPRGKVTAKNKQEYEMYYVNKVIKN